MRHAKTGLLACAAIAAPDQPAYSRILNRNSPIPLKRNLRDFMADMVTSDQAAQLRYAC
ncbi:hypothetical protein DPMN_092916 [Dreissena polymorpha]|uniref:Uncharacterized protein n=1 Tax=Dreissena polymorpha TaxID=45954 RepID=A0A9D4L3B8_DREPO|nr:hypothetical protein DPMN_092916 [Dreissena polymorpha]